MSPRKLNAHTAVQDIDGLVASTRETFRSGRTRPLAWRRKQIKAVIALIQNESHALIDALKADLSQLEFLVELGPIARICETANKALDNLDKWNRPSKRSTPPTVFPAHAYTVREPFGTVSIIGVWNFPFITVLCPLIGALAAGNCVIMKPSEVSEVSSSLLVDLVPKYLDSDAIKVVHGGIPQATRLLEQKVDKIFYTGNGHVGRIVMAAASKHLTPVVLELGGKNPVLVCESANVDLAAKRIVWGKMQNVGQACVSPDYVLVHPSILEEFTRRAVHYMGEFFSDPKNSSDLSRIINAHHTKRLASLLDKERGRVEVGGKYDIDSHFIEPTIISTDLDSPLMQDEIFGPILLIIDSKEYVSTPDKYMSWALDVVNDRDKPLALYVFSSKQKEIDYIVESTSSGGVTVNDTLMHATCLNLPFGGVGGSGMGNYHGRYSFECFSHEKGVLHKSEWFDSSLRYPPYTMSKVKAVKGLTKFMAWLPLLWILLPLLVVAGIWFQNPTRTSNVLALLGDRLLELFEDSSEFFTMLVNGDSGSIGTAASEHGVHK